MDEYSKELMKIIEPIARLINQNENALNVLRTLNRQYDEHRRKQKYPPEQDRPEQKDPPEPLPLRTCAEYTPAEDAVIVSALYCYLVGATPDLWGKDDDKDLVEWKGNGFPGIDYFALLPPNENETTEHDRQMWLARNYPEGAKGKLTIVIDRVGAVLEKAVKAESVGSEEVTKAGKATATSKARKRKKPPESIMKEARERLAAKMIAENPEITCMELAKILRCNKSTVSRMKAWQRRGVLSPQLRKGLLVRHDDDYSVDGIDE